MLRVRQRTSGVYTFTATAIDEDGSTVTVSSPAVTVKDGAGATVSSGTPTANGSTLSYAVTASLMAKLDTYTVTWTGTVSGSAWEWTDDVELVGGYLFEISELRALDRTFSDLTKYPTATLRDVRTQVEQVIEGHRAARLAFVQRGARATLDGAGVNPLSGDVRPLILPDFAASSVYSASISGTALTTEELAALVCDDNRLTGAVWTAGTRNVSVHYVYGLDRVPGPIKRAALYLAREYLVTSQLPGRATAQSIGDQTFRLTIAGRDGVTGLPEVDAAIAQHGRAAYVIG